MMKAVTTLTLALMLANPVTAEMYRWVDDNGNVYYTDRIPPDRINRDRTIMNKHGIEVETISPDRPEDIARKQLQEKLVSARQEMLKRRESEDSNLLQQYRSEEEILEKRNQHVRTFDIQIHGVESNIKRIRHKLIALQTEIDERQQKGNKVGEDKLQDLTRMHDRVTRETARMQSLEERKQEVIDEYIADQQRFSFLKQVSGESSNRISPSAILLTTEDLQQSASLYLCPPDQDCETQWQQAADYISTLSDTPVTIREPDLLLTREPDDDEQIGLHLIRSPAKANLGTWIFIDLNCRDTRKGYMYCKSEQAERIRDGFKQHIQSNRNIALKQ